MFHDLFFHDVAAHLVWWVAAGLFGMLVLFGLVELLDWLHEALHPRQSEADAEWRLHEPDTPLRRRSFRRLVPFLRYVHQSRPDVPHQDR